MKKTIAGILALLCVLSPLNGSWLPSGGESSSIIMEANAASNQTEVPDPGINAGDYNYAYADTQRYSTSFSLVSNKWKSEDEKFTYGIYKIRINPLDPKEEAPLAIDECIIGIYAANENVIDVDLTTDVNIPDNIQSAIETSKIKLKDQKVHYLAKNSFANSYLKKINLDGVEYIDENAFGKCAYITEIEIPKTVKYIGKSTFANSGLKTLTVLNELPVIPIEFCMGTPLTKLTFEHPELIRTISKSAFKNSSIPAPLFMSGYGYGDDVSGYEELTVGESAYEGCKSIKKVALPENVISLKTSAFRSCTSLTDIQFNNVINTIGTECFSGCTSIKEISGIPETIKDWVYTDEKKTQGHGLGTGVFKNCTTLESCTLPEALTIIPASTFNGCTAFTTIDFNKHSGGSNINMIGDSAFCKCTSLLSAKFENATIIDSAAYSGCTKLASANFPAAKFIGGTEGKIGEKYEKPALTGTGSAFSDCTSLVTVNIPSSQYIFQNSFKNCKSMTSFKAGKCEIVGNNALDGCSSMKEITLLSNQYGNAIVTKSNTSDGYIFQNCSSAVKITIDSTFLENFPFKTPNGFFNGCTKLAEIVGDFSKVTVVSTKTFSGCEALKEMTFEDIRIVENDAFSNCKSLTRISPKVVNDKGEEVSPTLNANDYGDNAFLNCPKLVFKVDSTISTVGKNAFKNSGVTSVNIDGMEGGTVVIGSSAFADCENLTYASITSDNAAKFSIGDGIFTNCPKLKEAKYQGSIITASMYKNCPLLEKLTTNAKNIKESAFDGDTKLAIVADMNDTSKSIIADEINQYAFRNCKALKVFPANQKTVLKGVSIFENCASIPEAEVGMLTASIFSGCTSLSDVKLKDTIEEIPKSAFAKCSSLKEIGIENMNNIGANAFDSAGLTSVKLNNAQTVNASAFANCSALKSVDVTASKIDSKAFNNCSALTDAVLNVSTIGTNAFDGCFTLTNVEFNGLTSLGANAFANCTALKQLTIKGDPTMGTKCVGFKNGKADPDFILLGDTGSKVENYAKSNNIKFYDADTYDPTAITTTTTTTKTTTTTTKTTTTTTSKTTSKSGNGNLLPGDANCDKEVDLSDAVLIMQSLANPDKYGVNGTDSKHITSQGLDNADVYERGSGVTTYDALQIQKYLLKSVSSLS
ncbi:leucine-rich repeat protein [uncultured Ruminococcus sp.]|uniref:leucine-rich repeat protein n=1 Tax=uncultured Ruminococcus sp. TaxID=165186 RepID=UPI002600E8E8|nr:leucine-rich repeat protein [uncultured Ruminococcus sp.]